MRTSIGIDTGVRPYSRQARDWAAMVQYVQEAERMGVDNCYSIEAWGGDAITPLAYLAGQTSRIRLGTGIAQISTRVPSMMAMTAMNLASMSDNRFILGLGVSGPQVVEGLHGVRFDKPLTRLREYIDILDLAFAGEKLVYSGSAYELPLPDGEGKALRISLPANRVPIYLATLAPKGLELTGERADGWLGTSFVPETAEAFLGPIRTGAERAGRSLSDIDIQVGGQLAFGDVGPMLPALKQSLAFSVGAMGSARTNFYNRAYQRAGYAEIVLKVQTLWQEGRQEDAVAAVPDELALQTAFIGTDEMVLDRLRAYRDAGVTTVRLNPGGETPSERLDTLARGLDLVRKISAE